jgi:hypothetical protein
MAELRRKYNMTDDELCMFTSNLVMHMRRDATEFTARGVVRGKNEDGACEFSDVLRVDR